MQTIEFYSHEQQDEYIYNIFAGKQNGFFLDISCGNPIVGNNSYTLEKFCGWTGIGFDLLDTEARDGWSQKRTSKFVQIDATSGQLTEYLKTNIPSDLVVDYISLDVDNGEISLALEVLKRILAAGVKFKSMTFEHEYYKHGPELRDEQRRLLKEQGMIMLFEDLKGWTIGPGNHNNTEYFEDWWIHPEYFDSKLLKAATYGLYTFEAIEYLRTVLGNTNYQARHNCSRAFPDEYNTFWDEADRRNWPYLQYQIGQLFEQYKLSKIS